MARKACRKKIDRLFPFFLFFFPAKPALGMLAPSLRRRPPRPPLIIVEDFASLSYRTVGLLQLGMLALRPTSLWTVVSTKITAIGAKEISNSECR